MTALHVSLELRRRAAEAGGRLALRTFGRRAESLTFAELEARVDASAHALRELGLGPGELAAVFLPPGADFVALFHALLRIGALPVLLDPGMGRPALLACLERTAPRALIGGARVQLARRLLPRAFRSVQVAISVGGGPRFGATRLEPLRERLRGEFAVQPVTADTPAAVLFTSGSTGPAKGVVHTHGNLAAELAALRDHYGLEPGEADGACFPLFALFDGALGLTSLFPELDPSRPSACDPAAVHRALEEGGASFAFASPAVWRRVVPWARVHGRRFTRLRRATIAGAPVPAALVAELKALLPTGGEVHTPYGATEALPVSDVSGTELALLGPEIERGGGSCVGRPLPGVELALVRVQDAPIPAWDESLRVAPGEPGEVCVRGAIVTTCYHGDEAATLAAKIPDGAGVWHRMGDVGRLDAEGRLWFLGRKSQRLETERGVLYPVPLENAFDGTHGVARSALVGVGPRGRERPFLVVEAARRDPALLARLHQRRAELPTAGEVEGFLFHPRFPVDARHNAKIRREELKEWAQRELGHPGRESR